MEMLRLSIIIPFYNVEQYIAECLDSVYQQNIPEEEYEVICVNDASHDHSREIVLEYQKLHSNLVLVEHEFNRKLGAARNTGRAVAKGNYIWNVDSDDKIELNCLGKLLRICEENELDVLEFATTRIIGNNEVIMKQTRLTECVVSGLDYMEMLEPNELSRMCVVWRRMIRRALLEDKHILSPEINMGEDVSFSFRVLMSAKRMMVISDRCYLYRTNPDSLTGNKWLPTPQTLYEKCFLNARLIYEVALDVPKEYPNVRASYIEAARYTLCLYPRYASRMPCKEQNAFRSTCRRLFFANNYVRYLLSKKRYCQYLLWILGLKSLPE